MKKKTMFFLLAFMLTTFTLLAIVIMWVFKYPGNNTGNDDNIIVGEVIEDESQSVTLVPTKEPTASPTPTKEPFKDIELLFSGDIYMSDYVTKQYDKSGIDGILSKELLEEFKAADVAMVNQEFTFSTGGTKAGDKQYTFRVNPQYVKAFTDMGIDIVTLANNHSMDFGIEALKDSFTTLNNADILYSGAGNNLEEARDIKYIEVQNKTFAYLSASRVIPEPGWNAGSNKAGMLTTYDPTNLVEDIKEARENSDFVVVYVHWGIEKATKPEEYQRNLAKAYIDAGADLVVGSHPHVLQGIEYYNSKPIVYSLGNFIFYNAIAQTAVLKVTVNEQNEATLKLLPARAENAQTSFVTLESVVTGFYKSMEEISFGIKFEPDGTVVSE
ncbi:MAG: hypothetical protein K0S61_400 [Anaerocolumna sp.]|jgi:poly-gamma-glutamate synthesis protein (capsule biosynthesis protein)|nr:hypothetical protein [Anaerocolumna sp.]